MVELSFDQMMEAAAQARLELEVAKYDRLVAEAKEEARLEFAEKRVRKQARYQNHRATQTEDPSAEPVPDRALVQSQPSQPELAFPPDSPAAGSERVTVEAREESRLDIAAKDARDAPTTALLKPSEPENFQVEPVPERADVEQPVQSQPSQPDPDTQSAQQLAGSGAVDREALSDQIILLQPEPETQPEQQPAEPGAIEGGPVSDQSKPLQPELASSTDAGLQERRLEFERTTAVAREQSRDDIAAKQTSQKSAEPRTVEGEPVPDLSKPLQPEPFEPDASAAQLVGK